MEVKGQDVSKREKICLERCFFEAENCRQKEDGTWDCSKTPEYCESHCRI